MNEELIAARRAELNRLTGAARTGTLVRLSELLADAYWRAGPGQPAARPHLDGAIAALDEAYGYLEPDDGLRGEVASQLGWLLGARHTAHGGPDQDRITGVHVLEEALTFPQLPPVRRTMALVSLGQLHLAGATRSLTSGGFAMAAMRAGGAPAETRHADRAAECFRKVLDGPPAGAEMTRAAEAMLSMAEAIRTMLSGFGGGGGLGFDLSKMTQAMATLQKIQQENPTGTAIPRVSLLDGDRLAAADPLDRPVAVVDSPIVTPPTTAPPTVPVHPASPPSPASLSAPTRPASPPAPTRRASPPAPTRRASPPAPTRPAAPPVDLAAEARADLDRRIAPDGARWPAVAALIDTPEPPEDVDDLVALAATADDRLMLAAAFWLRSRAGGDDGWGGSGSGDRSAAAEELVRAAPGVLTGEAAGVGVLLRLAVLTGALDRLADAFAGVRGLIHPLPDGSGILIDDGLTPITRPWPADARVIGDPDEPSTVASIAQALALTGRRRLPVTADPVFVATREQPSFDVMVIRRAFYPRSTGLGGTIEDVDGAGTADEVRDHRGASLLHLDCPAGPGGVLTLAGPSVLDPATLPPAAATGPGGVVVLPGGDHDFAAVADAFLAAGPLAVIGWRHPIPAPAAALMTFLVHRELVDHSRSPADAVRAVRAWAADPDQVRPGYLPSGYLGVPIDPAYARELVHRGA